MMKCPKCHVQMREAVCSGRPAWFCIMCDKILYRYVIGTMGSSTGNPQDQLKQPTPTDVPKRATGTSPGQLGGKNEHLQSEGEALFAEEWEKRHPEIPFEAEYKPCLHRDWRVDFAFLEGCAKVVVEVEGGGSYGHGRKNRYDGDIEKYNFLAYDGWALLRCTPAMLKSDACSFIRLVAETIERRKRSE